MRIKMAEQTRAIVCDLRVAFSPIPDDGIHDCENNCSDELQHVVASFMKFERKLCKSQFPSQLPNGVSGPPQSPLNSRRSEDHSQMPQRLKTCDNDSTGFRILESFWKSKTP